VRVVNISEKSENYARKIIDDLKKEGIRADGDLSGDTLNKKIRNSHAMKIPYTVILGEKELSEEKISVRDRKDRQRNMIDPPSSNPCCLRR